MNSFLHTTTEVIPEMEPPRAKRRYVRKRNQDDESKKLLLNNCTTLSELIDDVIIEVTILNSIKFSLIILFRVEKKQRS